MGVLHALSQGCQSMTKHFSCLWYDANLAQHDAHMQVGKLLTKIRCSNGACIHSGNQNETEEKLPSKCHSWTQEGTTSQRMLLLCSIAVCYADVPMQQWRLPGAVRIDKLRRVVPWYQTMLRALRSSTSRSRVQKRLYMCHLYWSCRAIITVCPVDTYFIHDMKCMYTV